jgi:CRISPR-associated endonuclease Csn1
MPAAMESPQKYVLGLDLGSASLGWAMIALDCAGKPTSLLHTGVRIFEPGVEGTSVDIQEGKDQSKAVDRRTARLHRRQLRRRAARQRELFHTLQATGLLPVGESGEKAGALERQALLNELDQSLVLKFSSFTDIAAEAALFAQMPLYLLRKRALDHALEPFELGRVLFHLIQRRGFKSNRKETKKSAKENEDQGAVKADIHSLELEIEAAGARTLGEYFAGLNPHNPTNDPRLRVRRRWTSRKMFETEFALIWEAQSPHHPSLSTQDLHDSVWKLLFDQRKVAEQKHLIGTCELERGDATHPPQRRAPWASMVAQRFRILQKVNDLKVIHPVSDNAEFLSAEDRMKLYRFLDTEGTQTFPAIRKHLGLKGYVFNLEKGGDKSLQGNRTQHSMLKVFGRFWYEFTEGKQNQIIENWRNSESDETLTEETVQHLGLTRAEAQLLVNEKAASDYCALSLKAIERLMPLMLEGISFKTAEKECYPDRDKVEIYNTVPEMRKVLPTLRNPAVERALTELRKVVNAIVREHGKPHEIRIELARELKKPRGERIKETDKIKKREKERADIAKKILQECGNSNPSRIDIEKGLLHRECGGICPYTEKSISFCNLYNDSEFDIEHIIPRSRFPDNSFQNKTLCHQSMNQLKGGRTPYEMYKGNPEEYEKLLNRVRAWPIKNRGKLDRFRVGEPGLKDDNSLEGFSQRQLNDTRYTSVAAAKLLATLYGGRERIAPDGSKEQAVYATSGSITATLRSTWGLEEILRELVPPQPGDTRGKPRIDHRHHAIDAITIAATRPAVIAAMARDSSRAIDPRTRPKIEQPWKDFIPSIRPHIEQLLVSHRPEHKLSGELHDETNYGRPYQQNQKTLVHVRKRVAGLSPKDIGNIVDTKIREAVERKAAELGGDLAACELKNDWPVLPTRNGGTIPIKKVRMKKVLDVTPVGNETRRRYVAESSNHHIAVYAQLDAAGKEKRWDGVIVSLLEAYQRISEAKRSEAYKKHRRSIPIIQRSIPGAEDLQFKFSLMGGDTVELHRTCNHAKEICNPEIYRIRTIAASGQLSLARITDARMKKEIIAAGDWWQPRVDGLRKLDCRKVLVDLQGRRRYAND